MCTRHAGDHVELGQWHILPQLSYLRRYELIQGRSRYAQCSGLTFAGTDPAQKATSERVDHAEHAWIKARSHSQVE